MKELTNKQLGMVSGAGGGILGGKLLRESALELAHL